MTAALTMPDIDRICEERQRRWQTFMAPGAPAGFLFHVHCQEVDAQLPPAPARWPDRASERIAWAWKKYELLCAQAAWLADDRVPYLDNLTGTEIFAEAFGCRVERPATGMPFALPCVRTAAEADTLRVPDLSTSTLAYLFDIADALYERAGSGAIQRLVDIQSPMDIAALIWDKADLFVAMIETPDVVRALAAKVRTLLVAFLEEWFRRYGTRYVAHYPEYFMAGGLTLSEDEVGAVNAGMFEAFFLPELAALSEHFGGIGIHCCADAGHQWSGFKKVPGLRLLNLCKPPTRDACAYVRKAYDFFDRSIVQMHNGWSPEGPVSTWPAQFPADRRVILQVSASTRADAMAACDALQNLRAKHEA